MRINKLHKTLGLVMVAPILLWAVTGFIFLSKPGYTAAYEQLSPRLHAFDRPVQLSGSKNWAEIKLLKTVLGYHLFVVEEGVWRHLDPFTLAVKPQPTRAEVKALIQDATKVGSERYGSITSVVGNTAFTNTDVVITLDWDTLTLRQEGPDTRLIDTLYRIHYLQWLSYPALNKVLGFSGLVLLIALSLIGLTTYIRGRNDNST